ncbi:methylenetetrahydrofolate dehydrogenase [Ruminococcaceae bacterium OttesenSCG-928-N02]|nr:methylenetetrahydrofolate dehydrogenase [Ruminococcaceae bacterium OttesenSCG-928-N02]
MKARIPKHREFTIAFPEGATRQEEAWEKLQTIMDDYKKQGKTVYNESFIEDNEEKVKALQEEYGFTYTIDWR